LEEEDAMNQTRKPKGKFGGPLVETEARRSPRLRNRNLGFKQSICSSKNCLSCSALPPSIPKKLMKTMGEDLCKIKPGKFEEEDLLVRKRGKQPIGSRKPKNSSDKEQDEEEGVQKPRTTPRRPESRPFSGLLFCCLTPL
jgi:hypothetical protein